MKSNYWNSLLTGTINGHAISVTPSENEWAMGSPDLNLWINSWNSTYPSNQLYIGYTQSAMEDGLIGYYIRNFSKSRRISI